MKQIFQFGPGMKRFLLFFLLLASPAFAVVNAYHIYDFENNLYSSVHGLTPTALGTSVFYSLTPTGTNGPHGLETLGAASFVSFTSSPWPNPKGAVAFDIRFPNQEPTDILPLLRATTSDFQFDVIPSAGQLKFSSFIPTSGGADGHNDANLIGAVGRMLSVIVSIGETGGNNVCTVYYWRPGYDTDWQTWDSWTMIGTPLLSSCPSQYICGGGGAGSLTWIDNLRFYDQPVLNPTLATIDYTYPKFRLWQEFGNSIKVEVYTSPCTTANNDADRAGVIYEAGNKNLDYSIFGQTVQGTGVGIFCPFHDATTGISSTVATGYGANSLIGRLNADLSTFTAATSPNLGVFLQALENDTFYGIPPSTTSANLYDCVGRAVSMTADSHASSPNPANASICVEIIGATTVNCGSQPCDPTAYNAVGQAVAADFKSKGYKVIYLSTTGTADTTCASDGLHWPPPKDQEVGIAEVDAAYINFEFPAPTPTPTPVPVKWGWKGLNIGIRPKLPVRP